MANWLKLPQEHEVALALKTLPPRKRKTILIAAAVFLISLLGLGWSINNHFSVIVPASGGSLREGVIGTPLFINPVLATSDTDRDLSALVYSGLMRVDDDGHLIPDLAEGYTVSPDNLTYTFILKEDLKWQDGKPLTTEDIKFTVEKAQDPLIKSPRRAGWEGVKAEVISPREIRFQLKKPYASFLETATMGILPKHIWNQFSVETFSLNQFNTEAVGSGPYKIKTIKRNKDTGIPEYYDLVPFKNFALGEARIGSLRLRFYPNENALVEGHLRREIDSLSAVSAGRASQLEDAGARVLTSPLPRVFAVFFNQNKAPIFLDQSARQALNAAVDRQAIIETILHGYGTPVEGPMPPQALSFVESSSSTIALSDQEASSSNRLAEARGILQENGWEWIESESIWQKKTKQGTQTLAFSIATSDVPELREAANLIAKTWTALGAKVEVKVYEIGDLNKDIIRPREYEALLFGQVLGRVPDLYSFWHSSQRSDPGNNIALYANTGVDKVLEELRATGNPGEAAKLYGKLDNAIRQETPAIFIYAPDFLYLMPSKVKHVEFRPINLPSDRFLSVYKWYIDTDKVWKVFAKENNN